MTAVGRKMSAGVIYFRFVLPRGVGGDDGLPVHETNFSTLEFDAVCQRCSDVMSLEAENLCFNLEFY